VVLHPLRVAASWNVVDALTGDGRGGSEPPGWEPVDSPTAASGPAMEQFCFRQQYLTMLVRGSYHWTDYHLSSRFRPIVTKPEPGEPVAARIPSAYQGLVGSLARYLENCNYCAFAFTSDDSLRLLHRTHEGRAVLAEVLLRLDQDHTYDVSLEFAGDRPLGIGDGTPLLQASDATYSTGKVRIVANVPARFQDVLVVDPGGVRQETRRRLTEDERIRLAERERYLQLSLVWTIATPSGGSIKHVRLVDLDGDGRKEILLTQSLDRVTYDACRMITCPTAIDLDGRIFWQFGRPSAFHGRPTSGVPFQVYDLDQDGQPEVMLTRGFQMPVLDDRIARAKLVALTPLAPSPENRFHRTIGHSLAIASLRGRPAPRDIPLIDRYHNVCAFDDGLRLPWTDSGVNTGHVPAVYHLNGDGRDDVVVGYNCLDDDGRPFWRLDVGDHADAIAIGAFDVDRPAELEIRMPAGDEGLPWVSPDRRTKRRERVRHVERIRIANYRPELAGLEMVSITFWGNRGSSRSTTPSGADTPRWNPTTSAARSAQSTAPATVRSWSSSAGEHGRAAYWTVGVGGCFRYRMMGTRSGAARQQTYSAMDVMSWSSGTTTGSGSKPSIAYSRARAYAVPEGCCLTT